MAGKRTFLNLKEPQIKSSGWLLLLAVGGILLILLGGALGRANQRPTGNALAVNEPAVASAARTSEGNDSVALSTLERDMSIELERILTRVTGAGRVSVSISLQTGTRVEYGANMQTTERKTQESDKQGGVRTVTEKTVNSQPVILRQSSTGGDRIAVMSAQRAAIAGVLIVSEGAGDSRVRDQLTRACMTLLNLPAHRIKVVQGKVGE